MKSEIYNAVKSMVAADPSVKGSQLELALLVLAADPVASRERIETAHKLMTGKLDPIQAMPLCRRAEAAHLLSVNIRTVDYYVRNHKLPCVRVGTRVRGIPRESVMELMMVRGEDPERAIR